MYLSISVVLINFCFCQFFCFIISTSCWFISYPLCSANGTYTQSQMRPTRIVSRSGNGNENSVSIMDGVLWKRSSINCRQIWQSYRVPELFEQTSYMVYSLLFLTSGYFVQHHCNEHTCVFSDWSFWQLQRGQFFHKNIIS